MCDEYDTLEIDRLFGSNFLRQYSCMNDSLQAKDQNATKKILIVEDDEFISDIYTKKLSDEGFLVFLAQDGGSAVKMLRECQPDILLLDLMIPVKTGFEVLEEIRNDSEFRDLKVIIMSNLNLDEDIARAQELGVSGYMVKAVTSLDDLVLKVREQLFPEMSDVQ